MEYLTNKEVDSWVSENGMSGYAAYSRTVSYVQPENYLGLEAFYLGFLEFFCQEEVLFYAEDWASYLPSQMLAFDALRQQDGELRLLIEAPGCLIGPGEHNKAILMMALASCFGWSTRVLIPKHKISFGNWEGECFDFSVSEFFDFATKDNNAELIGKMIELADMHSLKCW